MSEDARFRRIEDLFHRARALPDEKRPAFLDEACGDDFDLRERLERMLKHERAVTTGGKFPAADGPAGAARTGEEIGPYRLIERLGAGGQGEVWLARQTEPVSRRVALKILGPGMDSQAVIRRFEAERQAHFEAAMRFAEARLPAAHPFRRAAYREFAVLLRKLGENAEAERLETLSEHPDDAPGP